MKKKSLFCLPKMVLTSILEKEAINLDEIKSLTCTFQGVDVLAQCVVLSKYSEFERPSLFLMEFVSGKTKEIKLLLLKTPPILKFVDKKINYEDLEIYSRFEVGEILTHIDGENGDRVEPYLDIHDGSMGIFNVTNKKDKLSYRYTSKISKVVIDLFDSNHYDWLEEHYKTEDGEIILIRNTVVM